MTNEYVESKLMTKFGELNIRVYAAAKGHETVALWKNTPNLKTTALVRVHSECLTGDAFCGLNCDCGKQLAKALSLINKEGGVLIYLRQEGRGIGLFEKIKSYHFQKQGYDTFEANVVLGHAPDERTYEMAKVVLDDLGITSARLLTNNPAKVSELARYGVEISERVPLIIKPNKYNRRYFVAKKRKFNHYFNDKNHPYFYQFHAHSKDHVTLIGKYLEKKIKDPLLTICVGVPANHELLKNQQEIKRVRSIYEACTEYKKFIPVLHFSFKNSSNILNDLLEIKNLLPFVQRLQLNDINILSPSLLKFAFRLFALDIPFSDENFEFIHNENIRKIIDINNPYVILDNSKGRGIQENKDVLIKKIDTLLNYGINNIGVFGGFGPDELQTYFDLKKYYHINFSIDAETKLKTSGNIDVEKTKRYLFQLINRNEGKS